MKDYMKENPGDYVNPNFMLEVTNLIEKYYSNFEDDELADLIVDMFDM